MAYEEKDTCHMRRRIHVRALLDSATCRTRPWLERGVTMAFFFCRTHPRG
jgi:hypothetical protein